MSATVTGIAEDPVSERVEVRAFPHTDEVFVRRIEDAMRRMAPADPDALAALMRAMYPSVRVVPQAPLGAIGNSIVWYAYRDGVAVPAHQDDGASRQALEQGAC